MRYRRDRHSIKMDRANHMQELEEEKPSKSAEAAFRHRAYEMTGRKNDSDNRGRDADGQGKTEKA